MMLSRIGQIANDCWFEIPNHFPFVKLGEFVVMPNHIHGIITIHKPNHIDWDGGAQHQRIFDATVNDRNIDTGQRFFDATVNDRNIVETQDLASLHSKKHPTPDIGHGNQNSNHHPAPDHDTSYDHFGHPPTPKNQFGPQTRNLASIIRGYKTGVTKNARKINPHFSWQPRFHDSIIHNPKSFQRIQNYIHNNPIKWKTDRFNKG
jgi:REP element-mobilizing transposase RayT